MTVRVNWFRFVDLCLTSLLLTGVSVAQTSVSDKTAEKKRVREVMYFEASKVTASFEKAAVLVEGDKPDSHYKILTGRRDKPGQSELHVKDTDLIYILEGRATFVTGGEMIEGKTTAPDETRGSSIKDGTTRKLAKGDVIIVPNGVPHQFLEVSNPFLYYVVKVR